MLHLNLELRFALTGSFLLALLLFFAYPLCAKSAERKIRVAALDCPPFVMNDAGQFSGISIYLWENIAEQLGREYSIEEYGPKEMLEAVAQGKADIAVSCLSMTQKREEIIDFSHPFFETHLAIAVKQHGFLQTLRNFFYNERIFIALGIIVGVAALIGGILYLLEHNINDKLYSMKNKGGMLMEAFIAGLLFVTSGPIRYYEFKTLSGRTVAAFLAVGSTVLIASITALLASAFTLDQMHSEITRPQDLAKVKVGVMEASTSFEYLQEQGINSRTFSDRQKLLAALDAGRLDAVVGDNVVLKYEIKEAQAQGRHDTLSVLHFVFEKQNYAFALPDESPHLEKLNQALLSIRDTPEWKVEIVKYIGK
ncbi:MAG: transporter substrate-binding domain-containing protein [Gammaproteobacteria bacterium]|nr:transporter substrate-binding domain-containing protein [Gammaproteobacteria bacterium]NNJ96569.1 transporter substrate-binding domain-containing protein [Gammaproteobacteria bacterium]